MPTYTSAGTFFSERDFFHSSACARDIIRRATIVVE
jgi:hypothetical protein